MLRTLLILGACAGAGICAAQPQKTVCTITVNSADEKEALRSRLPPERYRFVELLQKGRADWLANACASPVQCDVLVVSGHFNAGDTFYSDRVETSDHLDVDQLERASCSGSCPGLFARLKEVYLFGCESLNPDASRYASSYGDSGRGRMQRIFANAALIYGFSGAAPVGLTAAMLLNRHFDTAPRALGSGQPSAGLLRAFAANGMTTARGVEATGRGAAERAAICSYFDERVTPARKLEGIHAMMRRDMAEVRASHDRITGLLASLTPAERLDGAYVQALATISVDESTRTLYLAATRAERIAPLRLRMIALAATFGWLTPAERQSELGAVVDHALASRTMGLAETSLICALDTAVEPGAANVRLAPSTGHNAAATAALACLGDVEARARTLQALASPDERAVQAAQVFLRHRPHVSAVEMRAMVREIAAMPGEASQVRALDALGRLPIADREVFDALARLFADARSIGVQRAIAEVYLRSSLVAHAQPGLAVTLRRHRIGPPGGADLIDQLLGRLAQA
jgi:hypothetical protein